MIVSRTPAEGTNQHERSMGSDISRRRWNAVAINDARDDGRQPPQTICAGDRWDYAARSDETPSGTLRDVVPDAYRCHTEAPPFL